MSTDTAPAATPPEEPTDAPAGMPETAAAAQTPETVDDAEPTEPTGGEPAPSARPLTAALLNLSGFGLGYLHLRAWARLVVALAATAALVWLALPIGREPIDAWWAVGYVGALVLFALDAALLARRRMRREVRRPTVWTPGAARRVAWATLAVVPLLGAAYVVTQHEVLEQYLAYDLDQAEESLESTGTAFPPYEKVYDAAYATYVRTAAEHSRTRAADRVPGLIDDLYAQAKGTDICNAVAAQRHFAKPGTTGALRDVARSELPGGLHDCGLRSTERGVLASARPMLTELLKDHPASDPAQDLPKELAAWRDDLIRNLTSKGGCTDTTLVTASTGFLGGFDAGKVSALADKARTEVPAGLLTCGVTQFEDRQYTAAHENLDALLDTYPRAKDADYAERLRIATGIAQLEPSAGVGLPARAEPEGTVTITVFNHSPDPFEMVYTGPATGVIAIDACDGCVYYAEGDEPECTSYSLTIPSTTVTIPAGDYRTAVGRKAWCAAGWTAASRRPNSRRTAPPASGQRGPEPRRPLPGRRIQFPRRPGSG
ncbi:hypothetical protein ACFT2C_22775 [Promicromonospora sp. NPDC057138]|uniref:hypothetical protein n=1 Tax=Promicromonospora sp. NPDC057138 TaxID=3346031 RepID=UPI0036381AAF